jgi:phage tail sheath protein FI
VFAPWVQIPGVPASGPVPTATRTVPASALAAAGCARIDAAGNPNVAPAGDAGLSTYAIGVTQAYSTADRAALNVAGVNVARYFNNTSVVKLYGFRTLSEDPLHTQMNWARLDMAIFADAQRIGEQVAGWAQIDARDQVFSRFQGALTGMLTSYFTKDALYGQQPEDAFTVDVGPDVNTITTRQAGQINAALAVKRAPVGEFVNIGVVSVALATPLG